MEATGPNWAASFARRSRQCWHPLGAGDCCWPHGSHQLHPCGKVSCLKCECWRVLPARPQPMPSLSSPKRALGNSGGISQREAIAMSRARFPPSQRPHSPPRHVTACHGRTVSVPWSGQAAWAPDPRRGLTLRTLLVPEVLRAVMQRCPLLQHCPAPSSSPAPALPTQLLVRHEPGIHSHGCRPRCPSALSLEAPTLVLWVAHPHCNAQLWLF